MSSDSAAGPPVETAITHRRGSPPRHRRCGAIDGSMARTLRDAAPAAHARRAAAAAAAAVSLRVSSSAIFDRSAETSPAGLVTKSTAPAASASNVSFAPCLVCAENITTGVGRCCMIARTVSAPFMPGMLKSIVTTSGSSSTTCASASCRPWPGRRPRSGPAASVFAIAARMNSESSTISTRIFVLPSCRRLLGAIASTT